MNRLLDALTRLTVWVVSRTFYRIRIVGAEYIPFHGPALLVSNHVSHIDSFLLGACVWRYIRFLIYRPYYNVRAFHWFLRFVHAIPVSAKARKDLFESIERARQELRAGELVCIYPEGGITRTGNLLPFKRGLEKIVEGLDVPVIPVHMDGLWGSLFSFKGGRFFWKWPERLRRDVTVSFGRPVRPPVTTAQLRQAIVELGAAAFEYRKRPGDLLHLRFLSMAKRRWFALCMADSTGKQLTWGKALIGALALARWLPQRAAGEAMVATVLPASVGGALANIAILLAGKVPVNLNFTAGREAMQSAITQCGIHTVLSSRQFLQKAKLERLAGMIFLEDVQGEIGALEKLRAAVTALLPARLLQRLYRVRGATPDSLATVIFSSGSTGAPKGVQLSHWNVISNVDACNQVFGITKHDCVMGVLPFFHAFGFTATLWFPLACGFRVVYHANPLDARTVGEMVAKYRASLLIATPTFFAAYIRRCAPEEFASVRLPITGGEKLRGGIAREYREKYGRDLLEGYGCTEMGPIVSVNTPEVVHGSERQSGFRVGTVGQPLPGVAVRAVDPATFESRSPAEPGLLLVTGPGRMLGYLRPPEQTACVFHDGWYISGDIAAVDEDGFIAITDRLSRFSKIAGEMVPHLRIEEAACAILGEESCAVTALPDEQRGERLVLLYSCVNVTPKELWERLSQSGLPRLWIPKIDGIHRVKELPKLSTGKLDLRRIMALARSLARD